MTEHRAFEGGDKAQVDQLWRSEGRVAEALLRPLAKVPSRTPQGSFRNTRAAEGAAA
jgi:hypothetical protein